MTNILALLLLVTGFISVVAAVPQLIKLLKVKRSDELSLFSWVAWLLYQVVSLLYSVAVQKYVYTFVNSLWVAFYLVMVILIVKYGHSPAKRFKQRT
jgi:uncharacterized protein with PQ loop repeat